MNATRREFLESLGIALASLLAARCGKTTCYEPLAITPSPAPLAAGWDDLRQSWLDLGRLAEEAGDLERGEETRDRLMADHRAALDDLVGRGELDAAVAEEMQVAYRSAATHVWRANAPITCYEPMLYPDYQMLSSSDLVRQADLLAEMAAQSDIDPATVEQARTAIERDIAYLSMPATEKEALIQALIDTAGDDRDYPGLGELELEVPPQSLEAAEVLVSLLLGQE